MEETCEAELRRLRREKRGLESIIYALVHAMPLTRREEAIVRRIAAGQLEEYEEGHE